METGQIGGRWGCVAVLPRHNHAAHFMLISSCPYLRPPPLPKHSAHVMTHNCLFDSAGVGAPFQPGIRRRAEDVGLAGRSRGKHGSFQTRRRVQRGGERRSKDARLAWRLDAPREAECPSRALKLPTVARAHEPHSSADVIPDALALRNELAPPGDGAEGCMCESPRETQAVYQDER